MNIHLAEKNKYKDVYLAEDTTQEVDSLGNPLTLEQVKFFANSKVRDRKGNLLVCYHNTDNDFDIFDKHKVKTGTFGNGFYFTTSEGNASSYGGKFTKQYYLNITKPAFIDEQYEDIHEYLEGEFGVDDFNVLLEHGYDGIVTPMYWGEDMFEYYVALEPNQIKSITNTNPTNSSNINEKIDLIYGIDESYLTESLHKLGSNCFITDSPYDIKNLIMNKPKLYRILYDSNIDMYMIGDGNEVIHWEMLIEANRRGYYHSQEYFIDTLGGDMNNYVDAGVYGVDNEDLQVDPYLLYMIFSPDDEAFMLGEDGYDSRLKFNFGCLFLRDADQGLMDNCDLIRILQKQSWANSSGLLESVQLNIDVNEAEQIAVKYVSSTPTYQSWIDTRGRFIDASSMGSHYNLVDEIFWQLSDKGKYQNIKPFELSNSDYDKMTSDILDSFASLGWVQIGLDCNWAGIFRRPTTAQYHALEEYLDYASHKGVVDFSVNVSTGTDFATSTYNLKEVTPEYIVSRIKRYFASGRLYEGASNRPTINEVQDYIEQNYTTSVAPPTGPTFITPKGLFIDFGNKDVHSQLDQEVYYGVNPEGNYTKEFGYTELFLPTLGFIRCNDGTTWGELLIELSDTNPTNAQYRALESWLIDSFEITSCNYLIIATNKGSERYDKDEYFAEDIIKIIKRYYSSGRLYENRNEMKESMDITNEVQRVVDNIMKNKSRYRNQDDLEDAIYSAIANCFSGMHGVTRDTADMIADVYEQELKRVGLSESYVTNDDGIVTQEQGDRFTVTAWKGNKLLYSGNSFEDAVEVYKQSEDKGEYCSFNDKAGFYQQDRVNRMVDQLSMNESNELEQRAKKHKKKSKGMGWHMAVNAGDVEKGVEVFNNSTADVGAGASMGESVETTTYHYTGPIYYDGMKIASKSDIYTSAPSLNVAARNVLYKAAHGDKELYHYDIVDEQIEVVSTEPREGQPEASNEKCYRCGYILNDMGECPVCDYGEDDLLESLSDLEALWKLSNFKD